jgi:hypothetical protein
LPSSGRGPLMAGSSVPLRLRCLANSEDNVVSTQFCKLIPVEKLKRVNWGPAQAFFTRKIVTLVLYRRHAS